MIIFVAAIIDIGNLSVATSRNIWNIISVLPTSSTSSLLSRPLDVILTDPIFVLVLDGNKEDEDEEDL